MSKSGKTRFVYLLLIPAMFNAGCQSQPEDDSLIDRMEDVIQEAITSNQDRDEMPESVSDALLPSMDLSTTKLPKMEDEQRFDISVNDVPADQFFLSLVEGTSFNMVIHPEVTGTITLNLKDVTIPDVLESVRDVYGFEFVSTGYGFQVLPGRLQARIYRVNYLNIQRTGSSSTLVSSGALTTGAVQGDSGNRSTQSTTSVFGTEIRTEQPETKFWAELQTSIVTIVGEGGGRSVVVNPQSGVVVVRGLPSELREVETFLRETQLIIQRQVILEAKIIEVRLTARNQTGINWASLFTSDSATVTAAQIGGGSVLVNESGVSGTAGLQSSLNPGNPSMLDNTLASAFGGVFSLALNFKDFSAFIELLKTQGDVNILSSPRIATLNNQKAVIKIGRDEFFVTDVSTQNVSSVSSTTISPDVTLTPFFSGIALDVTPQISEEGYVTLHVHPSISEVVDQQKTVTIGSIVQTLPLALSTIRETDSVVRARSGQVIVIGGLMQDTAANDSASAAGAADIPLFGNLFKHTSKNMVKSELVILLKPIVVEGDDQWWGALKQSADGIRSLKQQAK